MSLFDVKNVKEQVESGFKWQIWQKYEIFAFF